MSTELSNGVIIPEEYSDDWYDEMSINLRKLNDVITAASDNATDIQRLDTDKANQSDLTALTSRVSQNETDIIALQTAVSGALKREIVQTLPTEDISTTTIYMIRNSQSSGTNIYDEYMYINSQWELIGTSATDFGNYYTKNETDNLLSAKANQTDLTSLSGRVTQNETDITALQTAVSGALKREIVQSLPTQDISTTTIYMIRNTTTSGDNIYDEYMYINNLWELIGTSATDFSNYYTKTEIDTLLSGKQASLSQTQLDAVNSGIDSSKVQQIATNTSDISSLQSGKADDNSVVHLSGSETISGDKTWTNQQIWNANCQRRINSTFEKGETPSSNYGRNDYYTVKNGSTSYANALAVLGCLITTGNKVSTYFHALKNQAGVSTRTTFEVSYDTNTDQKEITTNADFLPTSSGQGIGNSTSKWATINGLNPSSLSLPDLNSGVDISSYITDLTGASNINKYTPVVNGWISVGLSNAEFIELYIPSSLMGGTFTKTSTNNYAQAFMPVIANKEVRISLKGASIGWAKFYPCQGNV